MNLEVFCIFQSIAVISPLLIDAQILPLLANKNSFKLAPEFFCHDSIVFNKFTALCYNKMFKAHLAYFLLQS